MNPHIVSVYVGYGISFFFQINKYDVVVYILFMHYFIIQFLRGLYAGFNGDGGVEIRLVINGANQCIRIRTGIRL